MSAEGASHHFLGRLPDSLDAVASEKQTVVQCQAGGRSAIAASILQAAGREVINMSGGYGSWVSSGLPVDDSEVALCDASTTQCSIEEARS